MSCNWCLCLALSSYPCRCSVADTDRWWCPVLLRAVMFGGMGLRRERWLFTDVTFGNISLNCLAQWLLQVPPGHSAFRHASWCLHTVFVGFVYVSAQQRLFDCTASTSGFCNKCGQCLYCAVRPRYLNVIRVNNFMYFFFDRMLFVDD